MAITILPRNYNISDAELCMFTSNLCNSLTRNLADLSKFGLTAQKISELKALGDEFEVFMSDEVYVAYIIGATEEKNALIERVKEEIRNMALRCQMKWGLNSWQEKGLGIAGMNRFIDDSLLTAARRVHLLMSDYVSDLAEFGLTNDILDDFEVLNNSLETAMNNQKNKINEREQKTKERITLGNQIYELVSKYCEIGKRVYAMSDPARYNEYIIYTPGPGSITAPTGLNYNAATKVISWTAVENATSYQVQISSDNENFAEIYAGAATYFVYSTPLTSLKFLQCRARNANGYGKWSEVVEVG